MDIPSKYKAVKINNDSWIKWTICLSVPTADNLYCCWTKSNTILKQKY